MSFQGGRTAASDELRSRIRESVLRSSQAISPSQISRTTKHKLRRGYTSSPGTSQPVNGRAERGEGVDQPSEDGRSRSGSGESESDQLEDDDARDKQDT